MKYILLLMSFAFAITIYYFVIIGIKNTVIIGNHTKIDYLKEKQ